MKKGSIILISILAVVLLVVLSFVGTYNSLIKLSENIDASSSDISVQLQRRADLIPNLVNTVKGYASHEENIINGITSAREHLNSANTLSEKAKANDELTTALNNLFVIVENYPDLKSNTNFINLQDELAGTENRISVARTRYNDEVRKYNKQIKVFPKNIIAGMFGLEKKEYFEAESGKTEVPNVSFEN